MNTEYIEAIKMMLKTNSINEVNEANHKALETGLINLDTFRAAARVLVKAYLN